MGTENNINWNILSLVLDEYIKYGYTYVELPWLIENEYTKITFNGDNPLTTVYGDLIGSAEQSFLKYAFENKLKENIPYVGLTPCFRDEPILDKTHKRHFMKIELFQFSKQSYPNKSYDMMQLAKHILEKYTSKPILIEHISENPIQYDLSISEIEIGSYGERYHRLPYSATCINGIFTELEITEIYWSYGTGLALPRFTIASNNM